MLLHFPCHLQPALSLLSCHPKPVEYRQTPREAVGLTSGWLGLCSAWSCHGICIELNSHTDIQSYSLGIFNNTMIIVYCKETVFIWPCMFPCLLGCDISLCTSVVCSCTLPALWSTMCWIRSKHIMQILQINHRYMKNWWSWNKINIQKLLLQTAK